MYLITIPVSSKFDAAKALADAFESGTLNDSIKSWELVGSALKITDARVMAQSIANDRQVAIEIRRAFISCGAHYASEVVKPEPKPEPKATAVESDIEWEPYDGVPADTLPPVNLEADTF